MLASPSYSIILRHTPSYSVILFTQCFFMYILFVTPVTQAVVLQAGTLHIAYSGITLNIPIVSDGMKSMA